VKLYNQIIPELMAKYHFTDKDTITNIIENIITDELDREKFKLAIKYPNGVQTEKEMWEEETRLALEETKNIDKWSS
tara:strand:- start:50 stop:280 length:231 start_codon:yes stop_codon:yes gene_type:complete